VNYLKREYMEKYKKITETIYAEDWYLTSGPPDVEIFKKALEHPQFKEISVVPSVCYGAIENIFVDVNIEREETEEEFALRLEKFKKRKEAEKRRAKTRGEKKLLKLKAQEEKELEQLAYLKKKYES